MVPSPAVTPAARRRATRSVTSALILAASSSPSSRDAVIADLQVSCRVFRPTGSVCTAQSPGGSVTEVSFAAGHDHGDARLVSRRHHFTVADGTPRLHHGGHSGVG